MSEKSTTSKKINKIILNLTIIDRMVINKLYPRESNMLTQILVKDIIKKTRIEQEEAHKIEFKELGNGKVEWNLDKAKDINVKFTDAEFKILKDSVDKLDKQAKITQDILELCIKIIDNK